MSFVRRVIRGMSVLLVAGLSACAHTSGAGPGSGDAGSASVSRVPRDVARFEIDSVTDSTAIFRVQEARWVRAGLTGYAVDPRQRDALVARVTVVSANGPFAVVQVTSQVALVKPEQVLLILRPEEHWWQRRGFRFGLGAGALLGTGITLLFSR